MNDNEKSEEAFSISFEDDFEGMPGVTQLLNPKAMAEKAQAKKPSGIPPARKQNPEPEAELATIELPASAPLPLNVNSLADLGVQFELQFELERGNFRYTRMKGHAQESLSLWQQKFYFQMKLDLQTLGVNTHFQEFTKEKDFFQADAFGLNERTPYLQVVRIEGNTQKCFVLISEKSLAGSVEKVRELLSKSVNHSSAPGSDDGEFKIELAS